MRTSSHCPKCSHNEILHATVPDEGDATTTTQMSIAMIEQKNLVFNTVRGVGQLMSSICRRCGYSELYCANPERIPVDGKWVTMTVGAPRT